MKKDSEQQTIDSYNAIAEDWSSKHNTSKYWEEGFDLFFKLVPKGSTLLEIGSGGGRDARDLITEYIYTGTDVSEELLKVAKRNNPKGKFLHQSVYDLDFPDNSFDAFWAAAVLLHIPKERIDEALTKIHSVVKSDGIGFISLKQGEGEEIVEEERTDGIVDKRLFSYYSKDEFKAILERDRFEVIEVLSLQTNRTTWLMFFVKVKNR